MRGESVTPLAGVWIEIYNFADDRRENGVTPLAGVWIEIYVAQGKCAGARMSLPLRECGLKLATYQSENL